MAKVTKYAYGSAGAAAKKIKKNRLDKIRDLELEKSLESTFINWCMRTEPPKENPTAHSRYVAELPKVIEFLHKKLMLRLDLSDEMITPFLQFFDSLTAQELQNPEFIMAWFTLADRGEIKQRYKNEPIEVDRLFDMAQINNQIVKPDFVDNHRHRILATVKDWRTTAPQAPMRQARPPQPSPVPKIAPTSEPPPKPAVKPAGIKAALPTQTLSTPAVTMPKPAPIILTSTMSGASEEDAVATWLTKKLKNWEAPGAQHAVAQKLVIDVVIREQAESRFIGAGHGFQSSFVLRACILSAMQFLGIEMLATNKPPQHKKVIHLDQTPLGKLSTKYPGWKSQIMQRYRQQQQH